MSTYTVDIVLPEDCDVERAGETVTLDVDADEYLLWAARDAGVWLPADCQQGWCCTCAAALLDGEVDQSDARRAYDVDAPETAAGTRRARDEAETEADGASLVLPCRATPASDVVLRACQYEAMLDRRATHDLPPGNSKR